MTNKSSVLRSRWADQFTELPNQSDFHDRVRTILTSGWFRNHKAYQEVPVFEVCEYHNHLHRFDWYIPSLNVIIELHGEQHYKFSNRGNVGYNTALAAFEAGRARDSAKKEAAVEEGIKYVEIPWSSRNKLTEENLKEWVLA